MKKNNPIIILILSYFISASAIIGIAFFVAPSSQDNSGFWNRVLWTEILNIIFWLGSSGWFTIGKSEKIAITPSMSLMITLVCFSSFILMVTEYKFTDNEILHKYHIAFQIGLFAICGLLILGVNLTSHYAGVGMDIPADAAKSPNDLSDYLLSIEKTWTEIGDENLIIKIKTLREKVKYSFQNNEKTRTNPEYVSFCTTILAFCNSFENPEISKENISKNTKNINLELSRLISNVERISSCIRRA